MFRRFRATSSLADIQQLLHDNSRSNLPPALMPLFGSIEALLIPKPRLLWIASLGQAFIDLFHVFIELYVPNMALDPAVIQRCEEEFWVSEDSSISSQLHLEIELERRWTGNATNSVVSYLQHET